MILELSKEQYRELLKLVFLGEWIVNANKEKVEEYEFSLAEQHVFSYCKEFDSEDMIEYEDDSETYVASEMLENEMMPYIEEFSDNMRGDFIGFN